ncbi:MAG: ankyrin repeat domain-containing protein [Cloacibacterium sp.]|nr:ankyrin repeat domain-containing protein [Cloacibacterium sp.]
MKKIFIIFGLISGAAFYAQELTDQMKGMLKYDNIDEFSTYVKKEDLNKCFQIKESSYSLLALSIKMDSQKFFQKLIDEKADLNLICDDKTPLMFATKYGNLALAKKLLERGADKNKKSNKGLTALDYAKKYDKPELVKILE